MGRPTAGELIQRLHLTSHPEGGWYRETYRSTEEVPLMALPERFTGNRSFSTAIYFLLEPGEISALHRIKADEMWHFYAGASLTVHMITPEGKHESFILGPDISTGESFQGIVPVGCWFGAEVTDNGTYSLVGCTVAPGFDFGDFEMGDQDSLLKEFPAHSEIIRRLTRKS